VEISARSCRGGKCRSGNNQHFPPLQNHANYAAVENTGVKIISLCTGLMLSTVEMFELACKSIDIRQIVFEMARDNIPSRRGV